MAMRKTFKAEIIDKGGLSLISPEDVEFLVTVETQVTITEMDEKDIAKKNFAKLSETSLIELYRSKVKLNLIKGFNLMQTFLSIKDDKQRAELLNSNLYVLRIIRALNMVSQTFLIEFQKVQHTYEAKLRIARQLRNSVRELKDMCYEFYGSNTEITEKIMVSIDSTLLSLSLLIIEIATNQIINTKPTTTNDHQHTQYRDLMLYLDDFAAYTEQFKKIPAEAQSRAKNENVIAFATFAANSFFYAYDQNEQRVDNAFEALAIMQKCNATWLTGIEDCLKSLLTGLLAKDFHNNIKYHQLSFTHVARLLATKACNEFCLEHMKMHIILIGKNLSQSLRTYKDTNNLSHLETAKQFMSLILENVPDFHRYKSFVMQYDYFIDLLIDNEQLTDANKHLRVFQNKINANTTISPEVKAQVNSAIEEKLETVKGQMANRIRILRSGGSLVQSQASLSAQSNSSLANKKNLITFSIFKSTEISADTEITSSNMDDKQNINREEKVQVDKAVTTKEIKDQSLAAATPLQDSSNTKDIIQSKTESKTELTEDSLSKDKVEEAPKLEKKSLNGNAEAKQLDDDSFETQTQESYLDFTKYKNKVKPIEPPAPTELSSAEKYHFSNKFAGEEVVPIYNNVIPIGTYYAFYPKENLRHYAKPGEHEKLQEIVRTGLIGADGHKIRYIPGQEHKFKVGKKRSNLRYFTEVKEQVVVEGKVRYILSFSILRNHDNQQKEYNDKDGKKNQTNQNRIKITKQQETGKQKKQR